MLKQRLNLLASMRSRSTHHESPYTCCSTLRRSRLFLTDPRGLAIIEQRARRLGLKRALRNRALHRIERVRRLQEPAASCRPGCGADCPPAATRHSPAPTNASRPAPRTSHADQASTGRRRHRLDDAATEEEDPRLPRVADLMFSRGDNWIIANSAEHVRRLILRHRRHLDPRRRPSPAATSSSPSHSGSTGPAASAQIIAALNGPLPHFCGRINWPPRLIHKPLRLHVHRVKPVEGTPASPRQRNGSPPCAPSGITQFRSIHSATMARASETHAGTRPLELNRRHNRQPGPLGSFSPAIVHRRSANAFGFRPKPVVELAHLLHQRNLARRRPLQQPQRPLNTPHSLLGSISKQIVRRQFVGQHQRRTVILEQRTTSNEIHRTVIPLRRLRQPPRPPPPRTTRLPQESYGHFGTAPLRPETGSEFGAIVGAFLLRRFGLGNGPLAISQPTSIGRWQHPRPSGSCK
jgi:hypothetical protein